MAEGLRVASIFASFSVKTELGSFTKAAESINDATRKIGSQLKGLGREASRLALPLGLAFADAAREAAKSSVPMEAAVTKIKMAHEQLASSVGVMLLPAFERLADTLARVANWFDSLSPATKKQISDFLVTTAAVLGTLTVLGRLGGVLIGVSRFASLLGSTFLSVGRLIVSVAGIAFSPWLLGAAAIIGVAALIYEAFTHNWLGIRDTFIKAWDYIKEHIGTIMDPLKKVLGFFKDQFIGLVDTLLSLVEKLASTSLGKRLGLDPQSIGDFRKDLNGWLNHVFTAEGAKELLGDATDLGKSIGSKISDGVKVGIGKIKDLLPDLSKYSNQVKIPKEQFEEMRSVAKVSPAFGSLSSAGIKTTAGPMAASFGNGNAAAQAQGALDSFLTELLRSSEDTSKQVTVYIRSAGAEFMADLGAGIRKFGNDMLDHLMKGAGLISDVIQSAIQGFQQGGPIGAVVNATVTLLEHSKQVQEIIGMLNTVLQRVADFLGKLLEPLEPLLGAIYDLVGGVLKALAPAFDAFKNVLDPLLAPIEMLGRVFAALAPVVKLLYSMIQLVLMPLQALSGVAMRVLFEALRVVALIILGVAYAIGSAWNVILGAIQGLLRAVGLDGWADDLEKLKVDTNGMAQAMGQLSAVTFDQATAQAKATAATMKLGDAATSAAEGLTNVPTGYRVALARFLAADTSGTPGTNSGSGGNGGSGGGGQGGGGSPGGGATHVHVYLDSREIASKVRIDAKLGNMALTGSTMSLAPRYSGAQ